MNPAVTAARTAGQLTIAEAIVVTADVFHGDEPRRPAAAILIGYALALVQNLVEKRVGYKLGAGRS